MANVVGCDEECPCIPVNRVDAYCTVHSALFINLQEHRERLKRMFPKWEMLSTGLTRHAIMANAVTAFAMERPDLEIRVAVLR